jgi:hypothetical protein
MRLFEIVKERVKKQEALAILKKDFDYNKLLLENEIKELIEFENMLGVNLDLNKVFIAKNILKCIGDIYGKADAGFGSLVIAELAIIDIANGCKHLKKQYFGNKRYSGYYQRSNHEYGYGPAHGGIVDEIALASDARERDLTEDEKDACIYYLKNYKLIMEQKEKDKI